MAKLKKFPPIDLREKAGNNMRTQEKKSHLNLSINPKLADLFENLQPLTGKTMSGFLEEKIIELAHELAPDMLMEIEIEATQKRLEELKTNYPAVKFQYENMREELKEEKVKKGDKEAENIEKLRDVAWESHLSSLIYQTKNKKQKNWTKLMEDMRFKNKFECMDYVEKRLVSEGIK
jgi:hypothetical protein